MITQWELKKLLRYNKQTGVFTWRVSIGGKSRQGKRAGSGGWIYRQLRVKGKNYREHRLVWLYVHGRWPKQIDHKNGDPHDNRITNLRECSTSQNHANRRVARNGLKGVEYDRKHDRWRARIRCGGPNQKFLGWYKTEKLAHRAYWSAAREVWGQFARRA